MTKSRVFSVLVGALLLLPCAGRAAAGVVAAEGVVRSDQYVQIKSSLAVPIQRIPVREGESVRTGAVLVEMANAVERAALDAAKTQVQIARSALAQGELSLAIATREYDRYLKVPDLITEKELELSHDAVKTAGVQVQTLRGDLAKAEAQVATAQANYDLTFIRAPFDGVVSRMYAHVGDTPRVSETALMDFFSLDTLSVEVALPLSYLPQIHPRMAVHLDIEDDHAAVHTAVVGKVRYVYPEVDTTTRMFRVKLDVARQGLRILPGMFAKVTIQVP